MSIAGHGNSIRTNRYLQLLWSAGWPACSARPSQQMSPYRATAGAARVLRQAQEASAA